MTWELNCAYEALEGKCVAWAAAKPTSDGFCIYFRNYFKKIVIRARELYFSDQFYKRWIIKVSLRIIVKPSVLRFSTKRGLNNRNFGWNQKLIKFSIY